MSDPRMMGGGAPPNPMVKPNPISKNMSPYNAADVSMQAQTGQISKDMSMKQWLENTYKLSVEAPFQQWLPALKSGLQNRNAVGKSQSMATQGPPMQGAPPQGMPPAGGAAPKGNVEALMGMMKGA